MSAVIIADVVRVVAVARVPSAVSGTKLTLWPCAAWKEPDSISLHLRIFFFPPLPLFLPFFFPPWLLLTAYFMLYDP